MNHNARGALHSTIRIAVVALALAGGVLFARTSEPAKATVPAAIDLADKALAAPTALEDESPYNMIDAIGPGGITRQQAVEEVTSRTMMGGLPAPAPGGAYGGGQ